MKKPFLTSLIMTALFFAGQDLFAQKQEPEKTRVLLADSTQLLAYPIEVMEIISNKCLGCHSPKGRSDKAKDALQWVELQKMEGADVVAKLDEISEVLEEGSMPPAKIVERFPQLELTDEEADLLKEWVENTVKEVMGE